MEHAIEHSSKLLADVKLLSFDAIICDAVVAGTLFVQRNFRTSCRSLVDS